MDRQLPIPPCPSATYRLQLHAGFKLAQATELVDYLSQLGITHVYASPVLTARPGSTHGYDVINHDQVNPELGTAQDFDQLVAALQARGMGLILDIVPNHMGVGGNDNAWWLDTLEWGEDSPYARFFDIDFKTKRPGLRGKVMIPVLGDQYGKVLQSGELTLSFDAVAGSFSAWYFDHRFPIDPRTYSQIVGAGASLPAAQRELLQRFEALAALEGGVYDAGQALKAELARQVGRDAGLAEQLGAAARALLGTPGDLGSWQRLHELLESQSYRPTYWRAAADEINYRRFFNINDLAGLRVELPEVFEATHRLVLRWVAEGKVQGLRIDHIDGLFDPKSYCEVLRERAQGPAGPAYIAVEKILAAHERLPAEWPIAGTSGYDSVSLINGLFVDPAGERSLDRVYRYVAGRQESFDDVLQACKRLVLQSAFASELTVLANALHRVSSSSLLTRDYTRRALRSAIEDIFVQLPVYRTYVTAQGASEQDRRYLDWAIGKARRAATTADTSIFELLRTVLMGHAPEGSEGGGSELAALAMRAQQLSGPVMAKGMEDTAFYRYHRLISLNEVGGDPRRFGVTLAQFHAANTERLSHWPSTMLAASTHDTKRGEDARARINLLSELPRQWLRQVALWMRVNRSRRRELEGARPAPHPVDEYLYYQTLMGAWPAELGASDEAGMLAFAERVVAFLQKAVREGKERSSWDNPDSEYEQALEQFVGETLRPSSTNPFPEQMASWVARIARWGAINSLSQSLLRLTIPGVPDTYQGSELWELSMVDPDNRRPVDYATRRRLLELALRVEAASLRPGEGQRALQELTAHWQDGREKLYLFRRVLTYRREHAQLFQSGSYVPLATAGAAAEHVCAFARQSASESAIVLVPRLLAKLQGDPATPPRWQDTTVAVPSGRYRCLLSGSLLDVTEPLPVARVFESFPVAMLVST